jgi:hypothetical protein
MDYSELVSDIQQIVNISPLHIAYCVLINISIPITNFVIDSVG